MSKLRGRRERIGQFQVQDLKSFLVVQQPVRKNGQVDASMPLSVNRFLLTGVNKVEEHIKDSNKVQNRVRHVGVVNPQLLKLFGKG